MNEVEEVLQQIKARRAKLERIHQETHGTSDVQLLEMPEFKSRKEAEAYLRRLTEMLEGLHQIIHSWGEWQRRPEWVAQDDERRAAAAGRS